MSHDHNSDEEWKLLVDEIIAQLKAGLLAIKRLNRVEDEVIYHANREYDGDFKQLCVSYAVALGWARHDLTAAMERLNRIVAIHDDARERKDYALSDQIRKALEISLPTPDRRLAKDIRADYQARFDVSAEKSLVAFLATPPA